LHELTIALGLLDEIAQEAQRQGARKVTAVHLRVGALSGVVPSALEFSWDLAAEGTIAQGSRLNIERIPLAVQCGSCAAQTEPAPGTGMRCLRCESEGTTIVRGRELELVGMEVVDEDAADRDPAQHTA